MVKSEVSGLKRINSLHRLLYVQTDGAGPLVKWFIREMTVMLERNHVMPDPLVVMLAEDVITHYLLVRQAHRALLEGEGEVKAGVASFENIFKLREKLRKSIGDFSGVCQSLSVPEGSSVAELFAEVNRTMSRDDIAPRTVSSTSLSDAPEAALPLKGMRPDTQAISSEKSDFGELVSVSLAGDDGV